MPLRVRYRALQPTKVEHPMFEKVSQYWDKIQTLLFPHLRFALGPLLPHHEKVAAILAAAEVEAFVEHNVAFTGRPPKSRKTIARAFLAKSSLGIAKTKEFRRELLTDHRLRQIVGWEYPDEVPSESVFSRVFAGFAKQKLPEAVHKKVIETAFEGALVCHLSRDAADIAAREKSKKEKESQEGKKAGPRQSPGACELQARSGKGFEELLQEIPRDCDSGCKVSSKGTRHYWIGYKLHVDVADGDIPVSFELTSASVHDVKLAIPLTLKSERVVQALYEPMDKGYYAIAVRDFIDGRGRKALIQKKAYGTENKEEAKQEAKAQDFLNWKPPEEDRLRYRTSTERVFSQLKDNYAGRAFYYRGNLKVACHLGFGLLALTIEQLFRLVT